MCVSGAIVLRAVGAWVGLNRVVADAASRGCNGVGNGRGAAVLCCCWHAEAYCENTDSEFVVELVVMVRVMSCCSTIPAALVTVSSWNCSPALVTL